MEPQTLDELIKKYRTNKSREAYLRHQLESLEHTLEMAKARMVSESVSLSQAITGMPHGSGTGDPTGKLATGFASGEVTVFVRQIQREIDETKTALSRIMPDIETVEIVLDALNEREREVFELRMLDDYSWPETLRKVNAKHGNSYSKRSLLRLLNRAVEKAYSVVA